MKINNVGLHFLFAFILLNKINVFATSSSNSQKTSIKRTKFTEDEDREILNLVKKYGTSNWKEIAKEMSTNRAVKSYRERYILYLAPGINNDSWSKEEDALLIKKHEEYGNRWCKIAKFFVNRTDHSVKNRFNLLKRKTKKSIINNLIISEFVTSKKIKNNSVSNKIQNKIVLPVLNSNNPENMEQVGFNDTIQDFLFSDFYDDYFDKF